MAFSIKQATSQVARYLVVGGGLGLTGATVYRYNSVVERERHLPSQTLEVFSPKDSNVLDEKDKRKRVIVIGGGVVGITTAYKLATKGHSVVVLEPRSYVAAECSACAAGGMQRSNPIVDRNTWIAVLKCIAPQMANVVFGGEKEGPYKFFHISWGPTLADPFFLRWLLTFTRTSLFPDKRQEERQLEMLKFTKYAVDEMVTMMEDPRDNMAKQSGYNSRGSLSLSYDPVTETAAKPSSPSSANATSSKMSFEPYRSLTSAEEIFDAEPSLRWQVSPPTAAKFEYEAKSASSGRFTKELADRCSNDPKLDVSILYETGVKAISVKGPLEKSDGGKTKPRISELRTNRGIIAVADDVKVVVAAGSWTPHVLALMNLYAPVYPLKGYAMSVSANEAMRHNLKSDDLPSRIVSDKYMFTTRLGDDEIRITSIGEFSGWNTGPTQHVDAEFHAEAIRQFPQLKDLIEKATTYCGHRPYINDGILLLGAIGTHENLYVSCGPGSNGWKLALGSGEIIERLVSDQTGEQISQDLQFDASTFSPSGRVLEAPFFSKLCRARWNV